MHTLCDGEELLAPPVVPSAFLPVRIGVGFLQRSEQAAQAVELKVKERRNRPRRRRIRAYGRISSGQREPNFLHALRVF